MTTEVKLRHAVGALGRELLECQEQNERLLRFIDAVSPFVSYVLDEPFPWKEGGQVITWMSRAEYDEALDALGALRD